MMAPQPQQNPDRHGYVDSLRMALQDPALNEFNLDGSLSPQTTSAILLLTQTIGYCRLYAITIPEELDGSLPASTAVSGGQILRSILQDAMQDADGYAERWELCTSQEEMETLACDMLHVRMHAWAIFVAIDEGVVAAARDGDPGAEELERLITELADAILKFDVALRRDEELLISALETQLIVNWRSMLAEEYQHVLPWWLDGTLEQTATRIQRSMELPVVAPGTRTRDLLTPVAARSIAPLADLLRFAQLQAIPVAPVLMAQSSTQPPHQSALKWQSPADPDGLTAILLVPRERDASESTTCRLQFHGPAKETLIGLPVALGTARAIIQSRDLTSLPDASVVEAIFFLEQIQLQDGHFRLVIQGERWLEAQSEERIR